MNRIVINRRQYLELEKLAFGVFSPLSGFMNEEDFISVVEDMRLTNGNIFPLPVFLDLSKEYTNRVCVGMTLILSFDGEDVGEVDVESIYSCEKKIVAAKIFGTSDVNHPGVAHFFSMGEIFIGGTVRLKKRVHFEFSDYELTPEETRSYFEKQGWRTIVGFQTRNVPHRAHEYLHRLALEIADGLFIQPLVGLKKRGD